MDTPTPSSVHLATWHRLWNAVSANAASATDLRARLNARLLAAMLVTFTLGFGVVDIYQSLTLPGYHVPWYGYVVLATAYSINRFLSYRVAAAITCLMFPAVLFSMFIGTPTVHSVHSLSYLALGIMLATILLSTWEAVVYAGLVLSLLATLPLLVDAPPEVTSHLATPFAMSAFGAVLSMVFSLHRDLLEKRRQRQLAESERRYRSFVTNFRGIAYEADADTLEPLLFEGAIEDITGYPPERFLSGELRWNSLIHEEDLPQVTASAERLRSEPGLVAHREYRIRHADGSIVWMRDIGQRVVDATTGAAMLQGALFDVTETHQLQERLRQSEKMEAVGQLAGGVAHDFNNQLTGIVGFAELLRYEASGNAELAHYADNIMVAARRAADLTSKLLAFARKGKFLATDIDVHRLVVEVVSLLRHSIDKRIEIHQHLNADPPCTLGDPTQIQNALLNLALNACDAMSNGGVLTFATDIVHRDDEWCREQPFDVLPGDFVRLSVGDTGAGIAQADLRRIFEPFFTTKAPGKGTGMGLAAVYGTVKNHHGAVVVESSLTRGSTFTLYLPLHKEPPAEQTVKQSTRAGNGPSRRVLVVDDEYLVLEMALSLLRKLGHEAVGARNGKEAVEVFGREHDSIDLVILDLAMPVMAGPEAFARMRAIAPSAKVVIASGFSRDGAAQKLLDDGAVAFVQKPFRREELARAMDEALRGHDAP